MTGMGPRQRTIFKNGAIVVGIETFGGFTVFNSDNAALELLIRSAVPQRKWWNCIGVWCLLSEIDLINQYHPSSSSTLVNSYLKPYFQQQHRAVKFMMTENNATEPLEQRLLELLSTFCDEPAHNHGHENGDDCDTATHLPHAEQQELNILALKILILVTTP
jgi:hypothetical protein